MKVLTIVGNGFDLGHQLPTSFDDFIESNAAEYKKKYLAFRGIDGKWKNVEAAYGERLCEVLGKRSWRDVSDVVDDIINNYGLNEYGEVDYYNYSSDAFVVEFQEIQSLIELLTDFEMDFQAYLKQECSFSTLCKIETFDRIRELLVSSDRIISFNYTSTIEIAYGVTNVDHIHGRLDTSIAIGSGTLDEAKESFIEDNYPTIEHFGKDKYGFQEMLGYYEYDDAGNIYPKAFVERFFNEVSAAERERENEVFDLLDVKNKDALESRKRIIDSLRKEHYNRVYILGHSLGQADHAVLNAINKDAEVICFYHSESTKGSMENELEVLGLRYKMIPNVKIYQ